MKQQCFPRELLLRLKTVVPQGFRHLQHLYELGTDQLEPFGMNGAH